MRHRNTVVYHIVCPYFGCSELTWSLRRNAEMLSARGVSVPRPKRYRSVVAEALSGTLSGDDALKGASFLPGDDFNRVFLADFDVMKSGATMWDGALWYPDLAANMARLSALFNGFDVHFLMSFCHPASLLSKATADEQPLPSDPKPANPFELSWFEIVADARQQAPDAGITAWCVEDNGFVWSDIMCAATGWPDTVGFADGLAPLKRMLSKAGFARLEKYLEERPGMPDALRKQVISVFVSKFAEVGDELADIETPGMASEMERELDQKYRQDIAAISKMEGVTLLTRGQVDRAALG